MEKIHGNLHVIVSCNVSMKTCKTCVSMYLSEKI